MTIKQLVIDKSCCYCPQSRGLRFSCVPLLGFMGSRMDSGWKLLCGNCSDWPSKQCLLL